MVPDEKNMQFQKFHYLDQVWQRYPPTKSRKARRQAAPVSTIVITKPKTKREIQRAKYNKRNNEEPNKLPDFFQVTPTRQQHSLDFSFTKKMKNKLKSERQIAKDILLRDDCNSLKYDIVEFEKKLEDQTKEMIRTTVNRFQHGVGLHRKERMKELSKMSSSKDRRRAGSTSIDLTGVQVKYFRSKVK